MPKRPRLYVEGADDQWVIANLLKRHGIELPRPPEDSTRPLIEHVDPADGTTSGVERLLELIPARVSLSESAVGFVIDADPSKGVKSRWQSVRGQLEQAGLTPPEEIPADGFIGDSSTYKIAVGVWLMPDNVRDGTLETFLHDLVDEQDSLIDFAKTSTGKAATMDQRFRDVDRSKAELHTWLAWQAHPGCPYGTAIAAKYFGVNSDAALAFVGWIKKLYGI